MTQYQTQPRVEWLLEDVGMGRTPLASGMRNRPRA